MGVIQDLERSLLVKDTAYLFTLLGEISTKLELAQDQAERLHAMLRAGQSAERDEDNTKDARVPVSNQS